MSETLCLASWIHGYGRPTAIAAGIFPLPVVHSGIGSFGKPPCIGPQGLEICQGKILGTGSRWMPKRFEEPRGNQSGNIGFSETKKPRRLGYSQPGRQVQQSKEFSLVCFHILRKLI